VRYLVDANVLSEPTKPAPDRRVIEWLRQNEREIAVDPIILGEVRFGILLLRRGKKRIELERWFDAGVLRLHCVPWEAETGLKWAQLLANLCASGRAMPVKDSLIAATALVHDLALSPATVPQGVFAPRATLKDVVARLNAEINTIVTAPDIKAKLREEGADVSPTTVEGSPRS
jgi:toxin FitB